MKFIQKTNENMIYLDENTTIVNIPRVSAIEGNRIQFVNQITHNNFKFNFTDLSENSTFYTINFSSQLSKFETGQYDYVILSGNKETGDCGIAQFGDYKPIVTDYKNNNDEIIQYNG